MITGLDKYRIILASRSPRRQQLLKDLGIKFEVVEMDYDETFPEDLQGEEAAIYLAKGKSSLFRNTLSDNDIVITADTIVWCNNTALGKPAGYEDARRMIQELSGNTHEVITGVSLLSTVKEISFCESTKVTFEKLSDEEIDFYIHEYKPFDKAGAYGIQEWIGIAACSRIEGSYFNVVGLPIQRLYRELQEFIRE
ncbi:MAG: Maf family nucleotide pyrophosphatase [Bacteroidales bacterium]